MRFETGSKGVNLCVIQPPFMRLISFRWMSMVTYIIPSDSLWLWDNSMKGKLHVGTLTSTVTYLKGDNRDLVNWIQGSDIVRRSQDSDREPRIWHLNNVYLQGIQDTHIHSNSTPSIAQARSPSKSISHVPKLGISTYVHER